jgi:CheY-like chemotaxis protein
MLTTLLELAGAKVAPARSVHEALACLDTVRPDVIVSDVGMPD